MKLNVSVQITSSFIEQCISFAKEQVTIEYNDLSWSVNFGRHSAYIHVHFYLMEDCSVKESQVIFFDCDMKAHGQQDDGYFTQPYQPTFKNVSIV